MGIYKVKERKGALFLFGANFTKFGVDIGKELISRNFSSSINGICTGGEKIVRKVTNSAGEKCGLIYDLEKEEGSFDSNSYNKNTLSFIEKELGSDALGKTIVSDRRLGIVFAEGSNAKPGWVMEKAKEDPLYFPVNYVANLYLFLDRVLKETNPNVVFLYAVAGAPAYLLYRMCVARGIIFTCQTPTGIEGRRLVDDNPYGEMTVVKEEMDQFSVNAMRFEEEAEWAKQYLERYQKYPADPDPLPPERFNPRFSTLFYNLIKFIGIYALGPALERAGRLSNARQKGRRAWYAFKQNWNKKFNKGRIFDVSAPKDKRWAYFPLHVQPEASTMVIAPMHVNQFSVIEALVKILPPDFLLVVKEHPVMYGIRDKKFLKKIKSLPRVVLVHPFQDSFWWIKNSTLTCVITGTAAGEAAQLGKPSLVIGNSTFLAIGEGLVHEPCLNNLGVSFQKAISQGGATKDTLIKFLSSVKKTSFKLENSMLMGGYEGFTPGRKEEVVNEFCDGIEYFIKKNYNLL